MCFSWLDCKTGKQILNNVKKDVFLLVPKEFGGENILEQCYDGQGNFGGYNVYSLVATWNKAYIDENIYRKPKAVDYIDSNMYKNAISKFERNIEILKKWQSSSLSHKELCEIYGEDFLQKIGMAIASSNEKNDSLKFPIKITYNKDAVYENCRYSLKDKNNGLEVYPCIVKLEQNFDVPRFLMDLQECDIEVEYDNVSNTISFKEKDYNAVHSMLTEEKYA